MGLLLALVEVKVVVVVVLRVGWMKMVRDVWRGDAAV